MSEHREIEQLRREIEQIRREIDQFKKRAEAAERQIQSDQKRAEAAERQIQKTTLKEYLRDCHRHIFKALQIADKSLSSTGHATRVKGKHYPMRLRRWDDFADIHRDHFDTIEKVFGDRQLFYQSMITEAMADVACRYPVANKKDIDTFEKFAIETPVWNILTKLLEAEPRTRQEFNFTGLRFTNNNREIKQESDVGQAEEDSSKRIASEREVKPSPTYPDGLGIRTHLEGDQNLAFVYDYKAAHKLTVEDLKSALIKTTLFMEVIERVNGNKIKLDPELKERDEADERVAMALTQVFDHMIQYGVVYGYVTTGKSSIFLHIKQDDLRTLYYHPCVPEEEADDENGDVNVFRTAVAQLASFSLLALRSEALQGSLLKRELQKAEAELKIWPELYEEAEEHVETESMDSSQSAPASQATDGSEVKSNTPPPGHEISSDSDSPPTRQYCTQACLLGLKRGWDLDERCPNVSLHRTIESGTRHPINSGTFTSLVEEQLRKNPYRDCVAVDPYGFQGKIGAIGVLFKLELAQYGYTFVGKGTQSVHLRCLQHESLVYSRLERLQGEVVPVHLGIVNLPRPWGYVLPGGARVVHMMLMSWGGEVAAGAGVPELTVELRRSSLAVWSEGVDHGDEREPNILWNVERRRVMFIDFDRAALRPAVKHKQLSTLLSGNGKRRKRSAA